MLYFSLAIAVFFFFFFSFCYLLWDLRNNNTKLFILLKKYHKDKIRFVLSTKASLIWRGSCLDGLPNTSRIPRVVPFFAFFPSLLKAISVNVELPVFCDVFFQISINNFVQWFRDRHVRIFLWSIYLQYCTITVSHSDTRRFSFDRSLTNGKRHSVYYWVLCNSPSYSRILIGSRLWSTRGQMHDWRHHYKFFLLRFKMAESFENLDNIVRDWEKDKNKKRIVGALNRYEKHSLEGKRKITPEVRRRARLNQTQNLLVSHRFTGTFQWTGRKL